MKINLSRIFRYILIILINILFIFVLQYYINLQTKISDSISNLQIAIFFNNSNTDNDNEENIISEISSNTKLKNIEVINSTDSDKFTEINSETDNVIPKETINFPSFLLANIININNISELENLKNEILNIETVEDFVYDKKAYTMFFDNKQLLNKYKKIFKFIFIVIIFLFVLKLLLFLIKSFYKDILLEIVCGLLMGLVAYAIICLAITFHQDNIFILSEQVLYILIPFSSMFALLTKESNA